MKEAMVDQLPDPDLFRDAVMLEASGSWSAQDLDATDAILVSLVRKIRSARIQARRQLR